MKVTYILNLGVEERKNAAAANRSRAFIQGLESIGVTAIILFPYQKMYKTAIIAKAMSFIAVFKYLSKATKNEYIIFYGESLYIFLSVLFKKKLKIIVERNEYPYYLIYPKYKKNKFRQRLHDKTLKLVDGLVTCSNSLQEYYKPLLSKNTPIYIAPLIIDISKFTEKVILSKNTAKYLGYCGGLENNKDGLPILIKAFSQITNKYPLLNLHIAGKASKIEEQELFDLAKELNIEDRVVFLGNIPHSDMPSFLANAMLLVLARPNNKQAEGGFPSKLGEYMSVKVPMVVTNVGELHHYLTDKFNCFMAEPDSVTKFSEKLIEAIEGKSNDLIALNAFDTVQQFDSKEQAKLLVNFLRNI
jgi:glycosyltransferase involved in cell wall biosynthesis